MVAVLRSGDTSKKSTTAARAEIWKVSLKLIAKKPVLGYGVGGEKNLLVNAYTELGLFYFAEQKLNAHNQFFQTGIAIGGLGLLVLILMLFIPLYFSLKNRYYLYGCFIVLIGFNFLTESMLERQAGVVFYALFNALFFIVYFDRNNQKSVVKT